MTESQFKNALQAAEDRIARLERANKEQLGANVVVGNFREPRPKELLQRPRREWGVPSLEWLEDKFRRIYARWKS